MVGSERNERLLQCPCFQKWGASWSYPKVLNLGKDYNAFLLKQQIIIVVPFDAILAYIIPKSSLVAHCILLSCSVVSCVCVLYNYTFCTESYTNIISMINQSPPYYPITYKDNNSVSNQFCCGT